MSVVPIELPEFGDTISWIACLKACRFRIVPIVHAATTVTIYMSNAVHMAWLAVNIVPVAMAADTKSTPTGRGPQINIILGRILRINLHIWQGFVNLIAKPAHESPQVLFPEYDYSVRLVLYRNPRSEHLGCNMLVCVFRRSQGGSPTTPPGITFPERNRRYCPVLVSVPLSARRSSGLGCLVPNQISLNPARRSPIPSNL